MAVRDSLRRLDDRVLPLPSGGTDMRRGSKPLARWIQRSEHDRHLAGVCGGLAATTGIDARIWRLAFVLLLPVAFWVYLLAWLFLPKESAG